MRQLQLDFMTNALTIRWLRILTIIEKEPTFILVDLAERLSVSHRTLVKDIHGIKQYFGECITLQAKQPGYQFEEVHHACYRKKKADLVEPEVLFVIVGEIFRGEFKSLLELAHEYSYGESTIRRFLLRAEKSLKAYGLKFTLNPVNLVGEEENIRKFYYDFYFGGEYTSHTIRPPKELRSIVIAQLSGQLSAYEVGTGASASAFYFLIYLVIMRAKQEQYVTVSASQKESVKKEEDFRLFSSLQSVLEEAFEVKIPEDELVWLYLILVNQRAMQAIEQEQLFIKRFNQWPLIQSLVGAYFSDPQFDRWDHEKLEGFLAAFLVSKCLMHTLHPIWNMLQVEERAQVSKKQAEAYQKNHQFLRQYQEDLGLEDPYFEDIVVEFTLFTNLLLASYSPQKTILFLLEGEGLLVQTIRQEAEQRIGNQHRLLFLQLQELMLERINGEEIDLIVTNYRPYLWEYPLKKDFLLVNTIPSEADWTRISQHLNRRVSSEMGQKQEERTEKLSEKPVVLRKNNPREEGYNGKHYDDAGVL